MAKVRYRCLAGTHEVKTCVGVHSDGSPKFEKKWYGPGRPHGEVFESEEDMMSQNGPPPLLPKFARADDPGFQETEESLAARIRSDQEKLAALKKGGAPAPAAKPAAQARGTDTAATLGAMTFEQLKRIAEEEEIDAASCKTKEALVKAILAVPAVGAGAR